MTAPRHLHRRQDHRPHRRRGPPATVAPRDDRGLPRSLAAPRPASPCRSIPTGGWASCMARFPIRRCTAPRSSASIPAPRRWACPATRAMSCSLTARMANPLAIFDADGLTAMAHRHGHHAGDTGAGPPRPRRDDDLRRGRAGPNGTCAPVSPVSRTRICASGRAMPPKAPRAACRIRRRWPTGSNFVADLAAALFRRRCDPHGHLGPHALPARRPARAGPARQPRRRQPRRQPRSRRRRGCTAAHVHRLPRKRQPRSRRNPRRARGRRRGSGLPP